MPDFTRTILIDRSEGLRSSLTYRILRGIQGQRERVREVLNCSSEQELLNLEWLKNTTVFGASVSSDEMGHSSPIIEVKCKTVQAGYYTLFRAPTDENNLNYRNNDGDIYTSLFYDGTRYNQEFVVVPNNENIPEFGRIGGYLTESISNDFELVSCTQQGSNEYFVGFPTWFASSIMLEYARLGEIFEGGLINHAYNNPASPINGHYWNRYRNGEEESYSGFVFEGMRSLFPINIDSWNGALYNVDFDTTANFYIFKTKQELEAYLLGGSPETALNYQTYEPEPETEEDEKVYYLYSDIKRGTTKNKRGMNTLYRHYVRLTCDNIGSGGRPVTGYVLSEPVRGLYNIELKIKDIAYIKKVETSENGIDWITTTWEQLENPNWTYKDTIKLSGGGQTYYYYGSNKTNIPIFGAEDEADGYTRGDHDGEGAKYPIPDDDHDEDDFPWGEPKDGSNQNNTLIPSVLSKSLIFDATGLQEVARTLYDETDRENILKGLEYMGETPLSFICDLFALPFDARVFCDYSSNNTIFYGTYSKQLNHSFNEILNTNKLVLMFSHFVEPEFNDYRDMLQNWYLYLPYVGFTQIEMSKYYNKEISCYVNVDVRSGSLKYYLRANGVNMDTFEGTVRVNMPLIGTDNYASSMNKIGAVSNAISNVAGSVPNKPNTSLLSGGLSVGGAVMGSAMNLGTELIKATPKTVTGNFSASTAIADELNAYLIVEKPTVIYPASIPLNYGLPDSRYGSVGSCVGFCQMDNIRLNTSATENEQNEIIGLLSSGIIV